MYWFFLNQWHWQWFECLSMFTLLAKFYTTRTPSPEASYWELRVYVCRQLRDQSDRAREHWRTETADPGRLRQAGRCVTASQHWRPVWKPHRLRQIHSKWTGNITRIQIIFLNCSERWCKISKKVEMQKILISVQRLTMKKVLHLIITWVHASHNAFFFCSCGL